MLDPKLIRTDLNILAERLKVKNFDLDVVLLEELEDARKVLQLETEKLQNERNTKSKSIGKAKALGEDFGEILNDMESLKSLLETKKNQLNEVQES